MDLRRIWTVTCRTEICKEGLETCVSNNCLGSRECTSIIDQLFPTCNRCIIEILDQNNYELIQGNYHLVCDANDDLEVKACMFYCRVNFYPNGECVIQNNVPICKCEVENEATTTSTTTTITTSPTTTTTLQGMLL